MKSREKSEQKTNDMSLPQHDYLTLPSNAGSPETGVWPLAPPMIDENDIATKSISEEVQRG